ncbi:MAG: TraR/DksA C4-type zinc finger protein [Anaerolineae bacterium]|nr:TraR/DksA C4-type zinc finger protein [Anaerolineae bacterium]
MVVQNLQEFQQMLLREHERLLAQLGHETSWANDHMGYGTHMADDGTEAFEQAKDQSMRTRLQDTLKSVQEALQKFDSGTYGVCESCEQKIDWARLEAKPHAKLCMKCKEKVDFRQ